MERFDQELLDRHRPLLRFDAQYDHRVLAASSAVEQDGNLLRREDGEVLARRAHGAGLDLDTLTAYPAGFRDCETDCLSFAPDHLGAARAMECDPRHNGRIYGRVVDDGGLTWLQYWFWLYYNPKNLFGFGKHEGDWEMIQIGLGGIGEPEVATYAQHDSGEARAWEEVERVGDRPVVYVAPLSHASYFEAGTHPYPIGIDHPFAGGPEADLPVVPFGPWVHWKGRWGSTERTIARRVGNGPPSPAHQGDKWARPAAWHGRLRHRRLRLRIGRLMHRIGTRTFPATPEITGAEAGAGRVTVSWSGGARHLAITAHDGHHVVGARTVRHAPAAGTAVVLIPEDRPVTAVQVSAYNRLRQRSDVREHRLTPWEPAALVRRIPSSAPVRADSGSAAP